MIEKVQQTDDPQQLWRKVNELVDRQNAWEAAVVSPQQAGSINTKGDKVEVNLSGIWDAIQELSRSVAIIGQSL